MPSPRRTEGQGRAQEGLGGSISVRDRPSASEPGPRHAAGPWGLQSVGRWAILLGLQAVALALILAPMVFWNGGVLEREATYFIPHYLDERGILQKIFDPLANDFGAYQARELSYALDLLDAHWFRLLLEHGILLFIPASALLASAATLIAFQAGVRKTLPRLDPVLASLVLLLYLSNYVHIATMGVYYRSSKPVLAPVLLIASLSLLHLTRCPPGAGGRRARMLLPAVLIVTLICVMSLLDRQGFFYAVLLFAGLGLYQVRRGGYGKLLWASLGAICLIVLYNLVLGPALVQALNGYRPDFSYQRIPVDDLITHPEYLVSSITLVLRALGLLLGSLPLWAYPPALVLLALLWAGTRDRGVAASAPLNRGMPERRRMRMPGWLLLTSLIVGGQTAMFSLMIARHPPVFEFEDHQLWYYPLGFQILAAVGLLALLERLHRRLSPHRMLILKLALAGLVLGNLAAWESHRRAMLDSCWFPDIYAQSNLLVRSAGTGHPHPRLNAEYRSFYAYMGRITSLPVQTPLLPDLPSISPPAVQGGANTQCSSDLRDDSAQVNSGYPPSAKTGSFPSGSRGSRGARADAGVEMTSLGRGAPSPGTLWPPEVPMRPVRDVLRTFQSIPASRQRAR